ncbi:MAG: hypothetical protein ACI7YS_14995, partial [Flavobacterium sp.]
YKEIMYLKKIVSLFIISILTLSCSSMQTSNSELDYWNKPPDLTNVTYEGEGKSAENAILIKNAMNERNGVAAEYAYISKIHGIKFVDWKPIGQSTITHNNKNIDIIDIEVINKSEKKSFYFDITEFYGKF